MVKLLRHEIVEFGDWLREASGGVGCEEAHLVWCLARLIAICCAGRAGGRNVFQSRGSCLQARETILNQLLL